VTLRTGTLGAVAWLLASSCEPTPVGVRGNGAFSPDGGRVLQLEARFDTFSRDEPWTEAPSATNWRALFLEGSADLATASPVAMFEDSPARVQALLQAPLYWLPEARVAVALVEGRAVGHHLLAARTFEYALPEDRRGEYFLFPGRDLRGEVEAVAAAPSPGGTRLAVLFSASYADPRTGAAGGPRYVHAVSFFAADGAHERTVPLAAFQDTDESLLLDVPAPLPVLAEGSQPVPAWNRAALLWEKDGSGVLVVDRDEERSEDGVVVAVTGQGLKVDAASGAVSAVAEVPAFPLATSGGPVSPDGKLLVTWTPEDAVNEAELQLHALDGPLRFDSLGTLPPADAGWAR
jgi:hypothetical protein